jgi:hypothetical protein
VPPGFLPWLKALSKRISIIVAIGLFALGTGFVSTLINWRHWRPLGLKGQTFASVLGGFIFGSIVVFGILESHLRTRWPPRGKAVGVALLVAFNAGVVLFILVALLGAGGIAYAWSHGLDPIDLAGISHHRSPD